jgi:flagellar hook protein FlgE
MSLYGSLFTGVSGLNAQGTAMSAMSDNIANINTIGYKAAETMFSTLVTAAATSSSYSSGAVNVNPRQLLDKQGLLQGTGNASDIAISGNGFMVVNNKTDATGDYLYTRAGSFRKDANGNFVNTAGYTLMAWPIDNEGRLPGEPGNITNTVSSALLQSLQPVSVKSIAGSVTPTTQVALNLNLKASENVFQGAGETVNFSSLIPNNYGIGAGDVISPENSIPYILNTGDSLTLTPSSPGVAYKFTYGGIARSGDITAGILGAATSKATFTGANAGDKFTISTTTTGTVTYTYTPNTPDTTKGQFNSLESLAKAISQTNGMTARITPDGKYLLLSPKDAQEAMTFADVTGTFAATLGLTNTVAATNRFATMQGLANLINASTGLKATINSPISNSTLMMYASNPLVTLTVAATGSGVAPAPVSTATSVLRTLGLNPVSGTVFGPAYDPAGAIADNIAGGKVKPHFNRNIRIFDSLGTGHDLQVSFLKTDFNTWSVEVFAAKPSEIISTRTDGLLASGTAVFNGDGTLQSVSSSLLSPMNITWADYSLTSQIEFNWGTAGQVYGTVGATAVGKTDGLGQLEADYNVYSTTQNGISFGLLNSISIDEFGYVIANFTNGASRKMYRIPVADFTNVNGLSNKGGNAYGESVTSGAYTLKVPGTGGIGKISPSTLEQANVEISDELTKMIVAQKGYQASSKIIKTVNEMLDELNRAIS